MTTAESDGDDRSTVALVDLSTLTDRQRQIAETATEMGYFVSDAASAEQVAAELDISQSTLSQYLRAIIHKILSQLFP